MKVLRIKKKKIGGNFKRKKEENNDLSPSPTSSILEYTPQMYDILNEDIINVVDGNYHPIFTREELFPEEIKQNFICICNLMAIFSYIMFELNDYLINNGYVDGEMVTVPDYTGCEVFYYILFTQHNMDVWFQYTLNEDAQKKLNQIRKNYITVNFKEQNQSINVSQYFAIYHPQRFIHL